VSWRDPDASPFPPALLAPTMAGMKVRTRPTPRIDRFLRSEEVLWLSTVRDDGLPHLVPIWFSWDGETILIVSKPGAVKIDAIRVNPRVMLALGDAEEDFDVALIEGRAELPDVPVATFLPESHWRKYARDLAGLGLTREEYLATYSQPLRIRPTRFLGWHGRSTPRGGAPAAIGAPAFVVG
jgi:PPOX class probable F420-dependent enzyme